MQIWNKLWKFCFLTKMNPRHNPFQVLLRLTALTQPKENVPMWLDLASPSITSATQNVPLAKRERALARVFLIVLLFFLEAKECHCCRQRENRGFREATGIALFELDILQVSQSSGSQILLPRSLLAPKKSRSSECWSAGSEHQRT